MWLTELFIYYVISQSFGEKWTNESYLLIAGMLILIYGTSIYNAPNNFGSILLDGHWYSFGIDCSKEYNAIIQQQQVREYYAAEDDAKSHRLLTSGDTSSTLESYYDSDDLLPHPLLDLEQ